MKGSFIIYADRDSLFEKIDRYSNPVNSWTTEICKHAACGYLLFAHCLFTILLVNIVWKIFMKIWKTMQRK